tara:strand:+ start:75 stop:506 length:432 start_codon:yes stop_codon:yes gene_type:complete
MNKLQFKPELSPKKMLEFGVFGGWYFEKKFDEYPALWFKKAKISDFGFNAELNYFGISAGLTKAEWERKGWIHAKDPLGWFQWYCRYTMGRRLDKIDKVQIARWHAFGPRHIGGIKKNCDKGDLSCRKKQRQSLLQWGYNPFF